MPAASTIMTKAELKANKAELKTQLVELKKVQKTADKEHAAILKAYDKAVIIAAKEHAATIKAYEKTATNNMKAVNKLENELTVLG